MPAGLVCMGAAHILTHLGLVGRGSLGNILFSCFFSFIFKNNI
jgi:hypothetical protein